MATEEITSQASPKTARSTRGSGRRRANTLFGILTRKERWGLSARGWFVLIFVGLLGAVVFITRIYSFLAETDRVDTQVLVVEGWIHEGGIRTTIEEYKTRRYSNVFTTGGVQIGSGENAIAPMAADVMADWLNYRGIPKDVLQPVPSSRIGRDRTYHSATALKGWFNDHHMQVRSLNVVTEAAHARRTRFLYRKAFGDSVAIGIIAASNPDYDPKRWWGSSDGFRDVFSETVAYLYARLLFSPNEGDR
jgi:uncharacterized SAM-binding protein YcdF (DUF218 family)